MRFFCLTNGIYEKILNQLIIYKIFSKTDPSLNPYPELLNPKYFLNLVFICPKP